jgi:hypothetical protein
VTRGVASCRVLGPVRREGMPGVLLLQPGEEASAVEEKALHRCAGKEITMGIATSEMTDSGRRGIHAESICCGRASLRM